MNFKYHCWLFSVVVFGMPWTVEASPNLKPGKWSFSYQDASHSSPFSRMLCISSDHTWSIVPSGGPIIPGNGRWAIDGKDVYLYGSIGEAIQGNANSMIGRIHESKALMGDYIDFNVSDVSTTAGYGTFTATFKGLCPSN